MRERKSPEISAPLARAGDPCERRPNVNTSSLPDVLLSPSRLSSRLHVFAFAFLFLISASTTTLHAEPFLIGADISWIPEDEAAGATYVDHGVQRDIVAILKDHGFNAIRLRMFVDPKSDRGYARSMPEAFC